MKTTPFRSFSVACLLLCLPAWALPFYVPESIRPFLTSENFFEPDPYSATGRALLETRVLSGGKRLRPLLCYLGGGLVGISPEDINSLACAAEWTHTASLVHDDIIDDSVSRRGLPTVWKMTSITQAILLGDWMLAEMIDRTLETDPSGNLTRKILEVIKGMAEGEFLQNELISRGTYTEDEYGQVALLKTGKLFAWSLAAGPQLAGAEDKVLTSLNEIGTLLGTAFQIRDDTLDGDERGEINFVLMKAAEHLHQSPLNGDLDRGINHGLKLAEQRIDLEIATLQQKLTHLEKALLPSEGNTPFRKQCLRSLLELSDRIAQP